MTLYQKSLAVERLFARLDKEIGTFATQSGLHCLSGCGLCCTKPDIDASVLEFLPMAMDYFRRGKAEEVLEQLRSAGPVCHVFRLVQAESGKGMCGSYSQRGLVCRLFGFSARRGREGQLQLYTCSSIKKEQSAEFILATETINRGLKVPVVSDYYRQLMNIDAELGGKLHPVNTAVIKALELVLHFYAYRRPPRRLRKAS